MKKNLYIHIGPGKSGTSAIQTFLAENHTLLNEYQYSYPELDDITSSSQGIVTGGNSATLAKAFLDDTHPFAIQDENIKKNILNRFEAILKNEKFHIILSSELFSMLEIDQIKNLKTLIDKYDFNTYFICYLRRHDQIIESDYAQQIKKHGYSKEIDKEYYNRIIHAYDFVKLIGNYEKVFGETSPIIRVYEKSQFKDKNILVDFLDSLGLYEYVPHFTLSQKVINPSPSRKMLEIMRLTNALSKNNDIDNQLLNLVFHHPSFQKKPTENYIDYTSKIEIIHSCLEMYKIVSHKYLHRNYLFKEELAPYTIEELSKTDIVETFLNLLEVKQS